MLTATQCETVGYMGEGYILCPECARKREGELTVSKVDAGMTTGSTLRPLSRYDVDTAESECAYQCEGETREEYNGESYCIGEGCHREYCEDCSTVLD